MINNILNYFKKESIQTFPIDVGYSLGLTISPEDQKFIIESCRKEGASVNDFEYGEVPPFWKMLVPRVIDPESCPEELGHWIRNNMHYDKIGYPNYYLKFHPEYQWKWNEDSTSQRLKQILEPYTVYFKKLSYVLVLMLMKGHEVPIHRDLVPGNRYKGLTSPYNSHPGELEDYYLGEKWFADKFSKYYVEGHEHHNYKSLRATFSEKIGEFGRSYFYLNGKREFYAPVGNSMVIDDRIFHGAEPVDFDRGVIFIDGIMDMEKIEKAKKTPLRHRFL